MSTMKSMERKAHQQTLSIRVSASVREYLERVKEVMSSSAGDRVSTSEAAKMLLESAKDDRLDHRLEAANLRRNTAESFWNIRQKWEQQQGLSHAEWLFLAGYVQVGCEEVAEDPERPKAESLAQVLEAFLTVRAFRLDRGVALDKYYVGNLDPSNTPPLNDRQLDPEMVPTIAAKLSNCVTQSVLHGRYSAAETSTLHCGTKPSQESPPSMMRSQIPCRRCSGWRHADIGWPNESQSVPRAVRATLSGDTSRRLPLTITDFPCS